MNGASEQYKAASVTDQPLRTGVDVFRLGELADQLDTVFDGTATADRTAAQMRSLSLTVADPNGTLAQSGLEPFATKLRPYRGMRIQRTTIVRDLHNDAASWAAGNHVGTAVVGGALTMAP